MKVANTQITRADPCSEIAETHERLASRWNRPPCRISQRR